MRKLLLLSLALLVITCGQKKDRKVLESEDGLVRITAWETPLSGMSGSYNTELEYEWEGKKHVVRQMDEDSDETVMMPMRLHSIGDNLNLLYQLYRESCWQVYLETEKNLLPLKEPVIPFECIQNSS